LPLGRIALPEAVAVFQHPSASFLTGITITVDGDIIRGGMSVSRRRTDCIPSKDITS
jgi:hypothetical protein